MKKIKLILAKIGYSNVGLIIGDSGSVMVDTGVQWNMKRIKLLFQKYNLIPSDIKLIVLTHVHRDHTGNLQKLKKLTDADVLVHKNEYQNLKNGFIPIPDGQGRYSQFISKMGKLLFPRFSSPRPFRAELINEDEYNLIEFRIKGKVIFTPGHSAGSQSVLIGKRLFSGDAFLNLPNGIIFPHFADDPRTLLQTWQRIFDMGIEEIFPGHGKPFAIEVALPEYEKWKRKVM